MKNNNKIFLGEFIASCFLVMVIVGSGIMAENLTNDNAVRLLANTISTGAGLFVLITSFANISGAHLNPFVSISMYLTKKIKGKELLTYIPAQILGCFLGVMLANVFFEHNIIELSTKNNPDLLIAKLEYEQSEKDVEIAKSDLSPTATISLEKNYTEDLSSTYDERNKNIFRN